MELFKLLGKIAIENEEANKCLDKTTSNAEKAKNKISTAFEKIGSVAKKLGKTITIGLTAGVTALAKFTKDSVGAYADYEQFVGGVETLFKESSSKVIEYANSAYKTAGMSANTYMETVTSFSANLLQGLKGDTEKATEIANMAIVDMSDNANKMGTDISMIQNAYQGFAKQNYTMLDNLKLGYGGTQSEMVRLINDSGVLEEKISDMNNVSFDTMIQAIHRIQENLDITGTTAKEASSTIQGSWGSLKASWNNLLVGFADGSQNLDGLVKNVIDSGKTYLDNLLPRIKEVLNSFESFLPSWAISIINKFKETSEKSGQAIQSLKEKIIEFSNGIQEARQWVGEHQTSLELLTIAIGTVTAAIVAYNVQQSIANAGGIARIATLAGLRLQFTLSTITMNLHTAATWAANTATTALSVAMSFLTSPITLVILAIETLIAIGVLLYKNWDTIKEKCSQLGSFISVKFDEMKTNMSNKVTEAKTIVLNTFDNIKNGIQDKINSAKEFVKNAIEKIKSFLKFEWSLPKLKMPHPKISGSFSLNPPSVPQFSIDWYKKAMDSPMLLTEATAFGIGKNGIRVGGEAGDEVVGGKDTIMNMISQAVSDKNTDIVYLLEKLLEILGIYLPRLAVATESGHVLNIDGKTFIEATIDDIDQALGEKASDRKRGN